MFRYWRLVANRSGSKRVYSFNFLSSNSYNYTLAHICPSLEFSVACWLTRQLDVSTGSPRGEKGDHQTSNFKYPHKPRALVLTPNRVDFNQSEVSITVQLTNHRPGLLQIQHLYNNPAVLSVITITMRIL